MRNRFENQSRTIKRRERSKTGVKEHGGGRGRREGMEGRVEKSRAVGEEEERTTKRRTHGVERESGREREPEEPAGRKSGREKKRMKIAVVKSTRVAPNAINRAKPESP